MKELFDVAVVDSMLWAKKYAWSYGNLADKDGNKTGIIYGLVNLAVRLLKKRAQKVIFAWECPGRLWRQEVDPAYKKGRTIGVAGDEFTQVTAARRILSSLDIDQVWADGFEADDVAGWVVGESRSMIYPISVLLVSDDQDWMQLVCGNVKIMSGGREPMDEGEAEKALGFPPAKVPLMKAVVGCKSDGIEGVANIRKKMVVELMEAANDWEDFEARTGTRAPEKWIAKILEAKDRLRRNFTLASIRRPASDQIEKIGGIWAPEKARDDLGGFGMAALIDRVKDLEEKRLKKLKEAWDADH